MFHFIIIHSYAFLLSFACLLALLLQPPQNPEFSLNPRNGARGDSRVLVRQRPAESFRCSHAMPCHGLTSLEPVCS
ncbi:hypothetical protein F4774DRAFT_371747 [Daldinia eschscholtzii]|nr:hypothetical protein F4774DRAFT_371747 [Daldinia eschscholtzii]